MLLTATPIWQGDKLNVSVFNPIKANEIKHMLKHKHTPKALMKGGQER